MVRKSKEGWTQIARARLGQWTPRTEKRFLQALTATCNVKAACDQVGMYPGSAYNHRRRWQRFADLWDEALETGYARIEAALLENACNLFSPAEIPPQLPMPGMTVQRAIMILQQRRGREKSGKWQRWKFQPKTLDEVKDSILRKLEALELSRRVSEEDKAAYRKRYEARREE